MRFDFERTPPVERFEAMTGAVVPRPIALVTSLDAEGWLNAAPYTITGRSREWWPQRVGRPGACTGKRSSASVPTPPSPGRRLKEPRSCAASAPSSRVPRPPPLGDR